ncbi:MAG TPA: hypothetical protein PKI01_04785 [Bacteroidales bacterium]|nr:hypothetical protein [Bacteroidales bacterium]
MKSVKVILLLSLVLIVFASCKKEGPQGPEGPSGPAGTSQTVNPELYGKWQVVSGLPETKYIIVYNNNMTYLLDSLEFGFKHIHEDMALITYAQIYLENTVFNYTISHDTLRLTNFSKNIVLKKNSNAPAETEWVTFVTVTDNIPSPTNVTGNFDIGYTNGKIAWTAKSPSDTLFLINSTTHDVSYLFINSVTNGSVNCATAFWISSDNRVYQVSPNNGLTLSSSPVLGSGRVNALTLVGANDMWLCIDNKIKTWNPLTNDITEKFELYANGMEYVGSYLYILQNELIFKCQISPTFQVVQTYYINDPNLNFWGNGGITYDGAHFWIVGQDNDTYQFSLYKLSF